MKQTNVFKRLWVYLRQYKSALFLGVILKVFGAIMNVLEPYVIGLAITEVTYNVADIMAGKEGASINFQYIGWILVIYMLRGTGYSLSAYGSNYYMTNAVQSAIRDLRNAMSEKINRIPVSYFDRL